MKQEKKKNESSDSDTEFSQSEIPKSGQQHDHTYHSYVKPDELIKNYEEKIDALKKQFEKERAEQKDEYDKMKKELRYEKCNSNNEAGELETRYCKESCKQSVI